MRFAKGQESWNKGLTKETDARVMRNALVRKGQIRSEEAKHNISLGRKGKGIGKQCLQKTKDKISMKLMGHIVTQEQRDKSSKIQRGRILSDEHKEKIRVASKRNWRDPIYRKKITEATTKQWQDLVLAEIMITRSLEGNQRAHPNGPEKKVIEILKSISTNIKYVGDGKYWVLGTGKNPDFIDEDRKLIIEVFGCYWHCCKKHFPDVVDRDLIIEKQYNKDASRINKFKNLGYSVLIIWEHELKCPERVLKKIKSMG